MSSAKKINSTSVQALQNLVREGELDGLTASKIQRDPKYSNLFGNISTLTFRPRRGRFRKKYAWPVCLTVSDQPHGVWIESKGDRKKPANYHGMVKSFDTMLSPMHRHDSRVETSAMIPINMKVETRPEIHYLSFPDSTRSRSEDN